MRSQIKEIVANLESRSEGNENSSIVLLRALLERYYWPGRYDSIHSVFMPKALESVLLTKEEMAEILEYLGLSLKNNKLSLQEKTSIVQMLGLARDVSAFEAMTKFISDNASIFDEQTAYCALVGLNPSSFPSEKHSAVLGVLEQTGMKKLLRTFAGSSDERLADLSRRIVNSIQKMEIEMQKQK